MDHGRRCGHLPDSYSEGQACCKQIWLRHMHTTHCSEKETVDREIEKRPATLELISMELLTILYTHRYVMRKLWIGTISRLSCAIYRSTNCAVNLQIDPTSTCHTTTSSFVAWVSESANGRTDASFLGIFPPSDWF